MTLVAPCKTTIRGLAGEVLLEPGDDPVPLRSAVNLDSVESVSVAVLVNRLGLLADTRMREMCGARDSGRLPSLTLGVAEADPVSGTRGRALVAGSDARCRAA